MKSVNTIASASSDEILTALSSDARKQWDLGIENISKETDTQFTVKYAGGYTERIAIKTFGDKNLQFVEENVNNGELYRYYEISPVLNRNLLRVTLYGKVSTFAFRARGKNTIKTLDRVVAYIQ